MSATGCQYFLWGTSATAYQLEGAWTLAGKGERI
ncbi:family 1 glycosylhydrolase [Herpetosiphon llansteffanensis]